jgi:aspartyl-tRNA(Asn)/glutamyl-tRNA(Gln) amidotransferase subunit A
VTADLRSIAELAPLVRSRAVSSLELTEGCLERIAARPELNAFITVMRDRALADARRADEEISRGTHRGPLHGVPVSVKDLVDIAGTPTTSGSAVPPRHPTVDAPIVTRLRNAGAVIVGKTNLHEFAFGTTSEESAFGAVRNPRDPRRSAGGSSGGAAVALVEGMCFGSIGTDTGGSIRIPSAVCGTVGLKPRYGELSCEGVVPLSPTLDHIGPMARSLVDVAIMFAVLKGAPVETDSRERFVFGVPESYFCERLHPDVRAALSRTRENLARAGHEVRVVEIANAGCTADVYLHIALPEASWYHADALATYADRYSPGVRLRLEMGRYILAEDHVRALHLRRMLRRSVDEALQDCDALLLPTLPVPAPVLGEASVDVDGSREPVRAVMLRLTQLFNLTGHPAIALPAGTTHDGWPVSVQLVGQHGKTERLLGIASAVER